MPDGFSEVAHSEPETLLKIKYDCMWGMRDKERHMMVNVSWKDSNKFLTKLVSEKSFAKQVDENYGRRYRKSGYRNYGFFECGIPGADTKAEGFDFSCVADGQPLEGEVVVFRQGIRTYTMTYTVYAENAVENKPIYELIRNSLTISMTSSSLSQLDCNRA